MEISEGLLGFMVLSGPLLLVLIWLPVSIWAAAGVSKRYAGGSLKRRISIGVLLFVAIFLVPFADGIAGRAYFNYLCATKAGMKVYQTVELPAEYWDEEGRPILKMFRSDSPGTINLVGVRDPIFQQVGFTEHYNNLFHIDRTGFRLREISSKNIFSEITYYKYWGGWLTRSFSLNNSAVSCEMKNLDDWIFAVFRSSVLK